MPGAAGFAAVIAFQLAGVVDLAPIIGQYTPVNDAVHSQYVFPAFLFNSEPLLLLLMLLPALTFLFPLC